MYQAIKINKLDNVVIAVEWIKKGDKVKYQDLDGSAKEVTSNEDTRIYHKIACKDIKKGEHIVKYGEHIGIASKDIRIGDWVHTHNIENDRENLESKAEEGVL